MNVSSHPAQVVIPNKDKERCSPFQILENLQNNYSLLKFGVKTKQHFIDSFFFAFYFDFRNSFFSSILNDEKEMWNSWVVYFPSNDESPLIYFKV